jgi:hypothetical protein
LIVHEAMIVVLILIFVILIVIVSVTNNLWNCDQNRFCENDLWCLIEISQRYWRFLLRFRTWDVLSQRFESVILRWSSLRLSKFIRLVFVERFADVSDEYSVPLIWSHLWFSRQSPL